LQKFIPAPLILL